MTTSSAASPSTSASYEVDSAALLKILLHAAKHPSSDVLGVLVGRPPKGQEAPSEADGIDDSSTPSVSGRVVDALPLFHESTGLTPMLEVALLQAAAHAKALNLSLLGVYAANEHLGDARLKPAVRAAAEAVARGSGSGSSCALLVNNAALPSFSEGKVDAEAGDVLILWLKRSSSGGSGGGKAVATAAASSTGGWERASSSSPPSLLRGAGGEERAKLFVQAVAKGLIDRVNDFDDHLLDLKKDWLNPGLLG